MPARAFAQAASTSQATGAAPVQLKIESNLVVVRAQVRDAKGQPVKGLTREDFKIFDRGKEQSVTQFEEESAPAVGLSPVAAPGETGAPLPRPPAERYIALYFDDLDTSAADLMQARDAADKFLAASLRPQDQVAIFTTGKALSNFTSDREQIHEALFQIHASPRAQSRAGECPALTDYQAEQLVLDNDPHSNEWMVALAEVKICAPPPDPRDTPTAIRMLAERISAQAQAQVRDNLGMFAQVVKYIAQAPGQRIVVLVSPGFLSESEQYAIDRTIDSALRSQVIINSLDPKGLAVLMREEDASNSSPILPGPRAAEARNQLDEASELVGTDVLAEVAQGTGGEFFHNDNDLKAGFDALAGHPDEYVLAFAPKDIKLDGKYHELKVALANKQKGYTIQARRGYFAVKEEAAAPAETSQPGNQPESQLISQPVSQSKDQSEAIAEASPAAQPSAGPAAEPAPSNAPSADDQDQHHIDDALRSKTESTDLPVGMEATPSEGLGATRLLALTVHLDTTALHLRNENAHHLDTLTFAVAAFDENDHVVEVKQRHAKVDLTDDQLPEFLSDGIDVDMMFELKPATYRLRVAVIESNEHRLSAFSRTVQVP